VSKDPRMLSTEDFAKHFVKDRGWEAARTRLVSRKAHPRAKFVSGVWIISRGARVLGHPRGKKRPNTEPPDLATDPEAAVEYVVMTLARITGIH
jgi:hypothetical protein